MPNFTEDPNGTVVARAMMINYRHSDSSDNCCDMRSHVVSEYVKGGRLMPKT